MTPRALAEHRTHRRKFVDVTPELILELLKVSPAGGRFGDVIVRAVDDPVPLDARAVRCGITEDGDVRLVIESDEFPEVGYVLKRLRPTYSSEIVAGLWFTREQVGDGEYPRARYCGV